MEIVVNVQQRLSDLKEQNEVMLLQIQNQQREIEKKDEELAIQQQALQQMELQIQQQQEERVPDSFLMTQISKLQDINLTPGTDITTSTQEAEAINSLTSDDDPKPKHMNLQVLNPKKISFNWKKYLVQPHKSVMQAVALNNKVYLTTDTDIVRVYSIKKDEWSTLPKIPNFLGCYSLVVHNETLVIIHVIKRVENDSVIHGKVAVWDDDKWTYPYPPLPTWRFFPSAASYKNYIIVSGGIVFRKDIISTIIVEILDTETSKWYTADALPMPCYDMDAVIINDTLYLAGGRCSFETNKHKQSNKVLAVSLETLIAKATSSGDNPACVSWEFLPDAPFIGSTYFPIGNTLASAGGQINVLFPFWKVIFGSQPRIDICDGIYSYSPEKKSWSLIDQLPTKCTQFTAAILNSREILILGGFTAIEISTSEPFHHSDRMYIGEICIREAEGN